MYEHYHFNSEGRLVPNDEGNPLSGCLGYVMGIILALIICAIFSTFTSCTTTRYVPVIEHRTDTVQITKHQRESIHVHDSIHVSENQKGDTVWMEVEKWHTKYIEKEKHDTTYIATHDTVPDPYPVPEYIEKKLTWWQQTRMHLGEALLAALLIAAVWWIIKKRAWWLSLLKKLI